MKYRGNAERQVALLQPFRLARQLSQPCSGRGGNGLRTRIIILAGSNGSRWHRRPNGLFHPIGFNGPRGQVRLTLSKRLRGRFFSVSFLQRLKNLVS
jgi:hypothetical protein